MPTYCTQTDVLRFLGGTTTTIQERFALELWDGPVTTVSVDTLDVDVPDTVLARIDVQIERASSRLNTAILNAYKAEPQSIPPHLTEAAAVIAGFQCVTTDGVRTDYMREAYADALTYFEKIANWELDLGIVAPRPEHRAPAAYVARGVGRRGRGRRRASYQVWDGCCPIQTDPCGCG